MEANAWLMQSHSLGITQEITATPHS